MFGLVEASAWMHVRNGTLKIIGLLGSESESVTAFFAYFLCCSKKVGSPKGRNTQQPL
ncbi:hypothetical protein [Psychromonas sp. SA13A]|uniref:hypothetical protein n=1 Tax=Psychromonas sp. SA13A TaxID=2686346 RepID=UPI0014079D1D|nr:hypothetical protein [Psychromonas sp. SA13A]